MRSRRPGVALKLTAVAAVVGIFLALVMRPAQHQIENPLSAMAKTPLGMNALYLLLKSEGVRVGMSGLNVDVLPPAATLVMGDDFPGTRAYLRIGLDELWRLAREQGNTVIYLPPIADREFGTVTGGREQHTHPETALTGGRPPANPDIGTVTYEVPWTVDNTGYLSLCTSGLPDKYFAGTEKLEAGGCRPSQVKPLAQYGDAAAAAQEVYLFAGTDRPFLLVSRSGKGTLVVCCAGELFTNRDIGRADNAVFAFNLFSRHARPELLFYEAIHGYREHSLGPGRLLLLTWWGQIVLLGLLGVGVILLPWVFPQGRHLQTPVVVFPSTRELINAQAELWRQAGHLRAALQYAVMNALGPAGSTTLDTLERRLRETGYSAPEATQHARALAGLPTGRSISPETIKAYDRILRRFGTIQRYL